MLLLNDGCTVLRMIRPFNHNLQLCVFILSDFLQAASRPTGHGGRILCPGILCTKSSNKNKYDSEITPINMRTFDAVLIYLNG